MKTVELSTNRRKLLTSLAIDFLCGNIDDAEVRFDKNEGQFDDDDDSFGEQKRLELNLNNRTIFAPTIKELEAIKEKGRNGNWRTKEIIGLALTFIQENLESLQDQYYYDGTQERFVDTHVSFDGKNFKLPTEAEYEELIDDIDNVVKSLPAIKTNQVAWDVFAPNEDGEYGLIDTVFYNANCDRNYVKHSLVNHDGYDPNITLRC